MRIKQSSKTIHQATTERKKNKPSQKSAHSEKIAISETRNNKNAATPSNMQPFHHPT